MKEYGWDRHTKIYWQQFHHPEYLINPNMEIVKFSILLVMSITASMTIDYDITRQIFRFVAYSCGVILLLLLWARRSVV